jgi:antitoxin component YwqK of YwqJK toxin-antitoxin module
MNLNHLISKIKSINSNIKFLGSFDENNRRTGYWEEYHDNGDVYSKGNYINGEAEGYWEYYYINGNIWQKGNYINDKRDGYWEEYWSNGNLWYKGNYKNGTFKSYNQ